jgi:hypothetical protein
MKDITVATMSPQAAATAFVAGQNDARDDVRAVSVERSRHSERRQDHRDHARLPDGHGHVRLHAGSSSRQPESVKALVDSYFEAVDMIKKEPAKSYEIMGADVKQTGEQFAKSAAYLRWQDKAANQNSSPANSRSSAPSPPTCCSSSASSSPSPTRDARRYAVHQVTTDHALQRASARMMRGRRAAIAGIVRSGTHWAARSRAALRGERDA